MAIVTKQCFRWVVMSVCLAFLASLFGCGRGWLVDGPGMERELWQEFTISQTSDEYGQNFCYTVRYDHATGTGRLYMEVPHKTKGYPEEKSIALSSKTVSELFNLNLLSFSEESTEAIASQAELLDGTFLKFSITDQNGIVSRKVLSAQAEQEILSLILPYAKKLTS